MARKTLEDYIREFLTRVENLRQNFAGIPLESL